MKKYALLLIPFLLLSGCSFEIDFSPSKVELYSSLIDELDQSFLEAAESLEPLKDKQSFTSQDEEQIINIVDTLLNEIQEFKNEEVPLMAKMIEKVVVKELDKKETVLLNIKEKSEEKTLTEKDLNSLIKTLSNDIEIEIKLFNKD